MVLRHLPEPTVHNRFRGELPLSLGEAKIYTNMQDEWEVIQEDKTRWFE